MQQYFLRTADEDVARYLRLFTFLPFHQIEAVMAHHAQDESKRVAQHLLAKEIVELAHGAADAKNAEAAHRGAFSYGTNMFSLGVLRRTLAEISSKEPRPGDVIEESSEEEQQLFNYKQEYAASSTSHSMEGPLTGPPKTESSDVVTLPLSLLQAGSFPRVLHAAGLVESKSEGRRLISRQGAYVVLPNSGSLEDPHGLKWARIPDNINNADPNRYLIDWEALVLRSGKSNIQICRVVTEEQFEAKGLTCPGWEEFKAQRAENAQM
jgi:tyrosyl-tRNA synthetase